MKLKYEDYKKFLESNQHENQIHYLKNWDWSRLSTRKNRIILRSQQRFICEKHNVLTEEVSKIALSEVDDKRIKSINSTETYAYATS